VSPKRTNDVRTRIHNREFPDWEENEQAMRIVREGMVQVDKRGVPVNSDLLLAHAKALVQLDRAADMPRERGQAGGKAPRKRRPSMQALIDFGERIAAAMKHEKRYSLVEFERRMRAALEQRFKTADTRVGWPFMDRNGKARMPARSTLSDYFKNHAPTSLHTRARSK